MPSHLELLSLSPSIQHLSGTRYVFIVDVSGNVDYAIPVPQDIAAFSGLIL